MKTFDLDRVRASAKEKDIISFDIFDTLLVRLSLHPDTVFHVLESGHGFRGFVELRRAAELEARELASACGREDTTLAEIYRVLAEKAGPGYAAARSVECETEKALLRPNREICALCRELVAQGKRIIAVSDMYHDSAFIRELLAGLELPFEKIYVSSETGCLKYTGRMFNYVLEDLGVAASQILHIGDNWKADVKGARSSGIDAILYPKISVQARAAPAVSDVLLDSPAEATVASLAAGMACYRWLAEGKPTDKRELSWWIGYCLLGPLSRLFVEWLYRQADANAIEHLYFLRRDGELWQRMFQRLYPQISSELLYGNRKLLQDADLESLLQLDRFPRDHALAFRISHGDSVLTIAEDLHFSEELRTALERDTAVTRAWQKAAVGERPGLFLDFIKRNGDAWRSYARSRRRALEDYYAARGLTSERRDRFALVDIGWRLSSFASLESVLGFAPPGFFLGVARGAHFSRGLLGFLFDYGKPAEAYELYRPEFIEILETLFGGCEPTAVALLQDGQVVLDELDDCENSRIELVRNAYEGAMSFCEDLVAGGDYVSALPRDKLAPEARDLAEAMTRRPDAALYGALSKLQFSAYAGRAASTRRPIGGVWRPAVDSDNRSGKAHPPLGASLANWIAAYNRSLVPGRLYDIFSALRVSRQARLIEASGWFDSDWYLSEYPDAAASGLRPAEHYIRFGVLVGHNPSAKFDSHAYLRMNPDVAAAGINPLVHFIENGQFELRSPGQ